MNVPKFSGNPGEIAANPPPLQAALFSDLIAAGDILFPEPFPLNYQGAYT